MFCILVATGLCVKLEVHSFCFCFSWLVFACTVFCSEIFGILTNPITYLSSGHNLSSKYLPSNASLELMTPKKELKLLKNSRENLSQKRKKAKNFFKL